MSLLSEIDAQEMPSYAQTLKAYRIGLLMPPVGGLIVVQVGTSVTRITPKEARDTIDWLEKKIADESTESSGGIALARYGERV